MLFECLSFGVGCACVTMLSRFHLEYQYVRCSSVSDLELICRQCKGDINLKLQTSESARKINTQGNIQLKLQTSNSTL